jgi:membrane fusion protein (multidrug efflux system)
MKRRIKWFYLLSALVVLVLLAFTIRRSSVNAVPREMENSLPKREKQQLAVDAYVIKPMLLIDEITVSGSLMAFEEVELKNEVAGRIVKINLPEGQFVKQGTLLVKLFDDDLQADLKKLQTQLAIQQQIYQRQAELLKVNGISQNDYEQTGLQINSIMADIEVEKVMIRKTEVLAPFDGVIGLRNISVGAQVTPSTLLAIIRSEKKLKLDFSVPEKYSPEIKPGMKIDFTLSNDERVHNATVFATEQGIDDLSRNLKVRAVVDNAYEHLLPGAFADVHLQLNKKDNAILIPTQAIIPEEDKKRVIVSHDGKAHFKEVTTGMRKASLVEITSGIDPGDTVITTGILFLKEGSHLSFSTINSDTI